ncbi:MAG TPA: methyltransferase domain-containing protein [Planctomycetota bacterium]|nr:methyltransferase domain-containing protein [Planctomycetota bacterium]
MLRSIIRFNRKCSEWLSYRLPQNRPPDLFDDYIRTVIEKMNERPGLLVADVGGGRSCRFSAHRKTEPKARIVAIDISDEELKLNNDVDDKRVANIMQSLPFKKKEIDMLVSSSVLEHLEDIELFIANASRALNDNGWFIHLCPSKFASFSVINQLLPQALSKRIVHFIRPETVGICGFPAHYNRCYPSAMKAMLTKHGFEPVEIRVSYFETYWDFCFPLFVLVSLYETLAFYAGFKNLATYMLIVSRKKPDAVPAVVSSPLAGEGRERG